jgi:hypothetical protein
MSSTTPNELLVTPHPRNENSYSQTNAHGSTTSSLIPGARPEPRRSPRFQLPEEESATGSEDEDASPVKGVLSVVAAINAAVTTDMSTLAVRNDSARTAPLVVVTGNSNGKIIFCDIDNCVGLMDPPAMVCLLCEADIHGSCFTDHIRKLKEYPVGCHNQVKKLVKMAKTSK